MSETRSGSKELLAAVRETNALLEALPLHTHQRAVEALVVLVNHRLADQAHEQSEIQRQAELNRAFAVTH